MPVISLATRVNCNGQHVALNAQTQAIEKNVSHTSLLKDDPGAGISGAMSRALVYIYLLTKREKWKKSSVAEMSPGPNKIN